MKKIFMIGKFNTVFHDVNNCLVDYFNVQVCVDNIEIIRGMLKLSRPDLIIFSLIGINSETGDVFKEIGFNYEDIPVICIGTTMEFSSFDMFFKTEQFHMLIRPVSNERILETTCKLLDLEYDPVKGVVKDKKAKRKCVLLVDDNVTQLRTLKEMLKDKYDVHMATSGMKGLTLIGKRVPDIIFLDYDMPLCDGKMTLQMIREIDELKDIPVVFLTGLGDKSHIQSVLSLKPAGYLLKPASAEMILETIDSIFNKDEDM